MSAYAYTVTPFLAWLLAGVLKFAINSVKARRLAYDLIGYGGLPSNHSAIVSSMATLIALRAGIDTPEFGVALTLAFIVILDASSLRRQIGKQAAAINQLRGLENNDSNFLRVRMGHTRLEIVAGILVGIFTALCVSSLI